MDRELKEQKEWVRCDSKTADYSMFVNLSFIAKETVEKDEIWR